MTGRPGGRTALILNSRQGKQPTGGDLWVENTSAAVAYAVGQNLTLVTSLGMNTYEFVTYLGSALGARMILLVPARSDFKNRIVEQFNLDRTKVIFQEVESKRSTPKDWWLERDRRAMELADLILPISINPGGNLAKMIESVERSSITIDRRFAVPYSKWKDRLFNPVDESCLAIPGQTEWPYLTHWTHTFHGPWPNQRAYDYYRMVLNSREHYSHTALNSLRNILTCKKVFATSEHIRGGYEVVSFTDHHPTDAVRLMKWRARFVRWNFEPYGVAIDTEYAQSIGIRPVTYGSSKSYTALSENDKPYFQNEGEKAGDWKPEREWRLHGDLDLRKIPYDKMKVIVRRKSEIDQVQDLTSSEIIPLTDEDDVRHR